jgi:hypothetical protein
MLCTLEFLVHFLKVFPKNQKMMPDKHQRVTKLMFVMMGGIYPLSIVQGVMNLENP